MGLGLYVVIGTSGTVGYRFTRPFARTSILLVFHFDEDIISSMSDQYQV